jgi:hypothetical protein
VTWLKGRGVVTCAVVQGSLLGFMSSWVALYC